MARVRIASTIGPIDSGIVPALATAYQQATGVEVAYHGAGTNAALELAKRGGFEVVLAHAPRLEERFLAEGYAAERRELMHNDFVLFGPPSDPAQVRGAGGAPEALARIARTESLCLTRGDLSGTHVKEVKIWEAAGIEPAGEWYRRAERGTQGNTATAEEADSQGAYTLLDRATALAVEPRLTRIGPLYAGDPALLNIISVLQVSAARVADVDAEQGERLFGWLLGDAARELIAAFGVQRFGRPLYVPRTAPSASHAPR